MNSIEDPSIIDLKRMTKSQLIDFIIELQVHNMQMTDRRDSSLDAAKNEIRRGRERLAKAEGYVEQGRGIIESIMERWYHYD